MSRYILGTDTFDNEVFAVCLFDVENNNVVISESIFGEKDFEKRVKELTEFYNCGRIEEFEIKEPSKNRVYAKIPSISQTIGNYFKTDKGKQVMKDYLYGEDCIDYGLLKEFKNFAQKT